ncbi:hypothetical protein SAMN05421772_106157 [Paracoccus saliphilus]|uniref:Uncharacterized protein n=1 Tax=Paracoccus saliphilus TaxID=405559 RepID=A0AA45W4G9_9RHOB|nr:hypothetical protein SAMN05421772_106157 [Paracoccus saliphilus]
MIRRAGLALVAGRRRGLTGTERGDESRAGCCQDLIGLRPAMAGGLPAPGPPEVFV